MKSRVADFTVEGRGEFPFDMLRRSEAFPTDAASVAALSATDGERRRVNLRTNDFHMILPERWESFCWRVVKDSSLSEPISIPQMITTTVPSGWRVQQEANRRWSVYEGEAYRKGDFLTSDDAQRWFNDFVADLFV